MESLPKIEEDAMALPAKGRTRLAVTLLRSLPAFLEDGIAEAERRDAELDRDSSCGMSMEEFKAAFGS